MGLSDYSLPHKLVSNANGSFTFSNITYGRRLVGDDDTNPMPSFKGQKINDIFFFKNRLGFLSGENVIMSENGDFYNFFVRTVLTTLDSAPIDASVSNNQVSVLKHAVPFDSSLLIFSDLNQFRLEGDGVLTNETISINVSTSFEADLAAKPVSAGKNVYFATNRNFFGGVREYFVDSEIETNDANTQGDNDVVKVSYAYGPVTATYSTSETTATTDTSSGATDSYAISYTVSDELSVTYGSETHEEDGQTTDVEVDGFSVAYTTGGMTISAVMQSAENLNHETGSQYDVDYWKLGASFAF